MPARIGRPPIPKSVPLAPIFDKFWSAERRAGRWGIALAVLGLFLLQSQPAHFGLVVVGGGVGLCAFAVGFRVGWSSREEYTREYAAAIDREKRAEDG